MSQGRFTRIDVGQAPGVVAPALLEARLPSFIGLTVSAPERLAGLAVVVVGTGSVGSNIALHLARLHVGELRLVDKGKLKAESVITHPIWPDMVGMAKAIAIGELCQRISPTTRVLVFDGQVEALDLLAFADADLVVLATDNLLAEVETGERCVHLGKPLVQGSVHGDTLVAQCRFLANRDGDGPCPACAFSSAEWMALSSGVTYPCDGSSAGPPSASVTTQPTMSTSFLCGTAANLVLVQALRATLGLGQPVEDTVVEWCGFTHRVVVTKLRRNPNCPCDHIVYRQVPCPRAIPECSLREVAALAGLDGGSDDLTFTVGNLVFATLGACQCGGDRPLRRFQPAGREAERCPGCGTAVRAQPFYCFPSAPRSVVLDVLDRPLRELGAGSAEWVVVRSGDQGVLIRGPGSRADDSSGDVVRGA